MFLIYNNSFSKAIKPSSLKEYLKKRHPDKVNKYFSFFKYKETLTNKIHCLKQRNICEWLIVSYEIMQIL